MVSILLLSKTSTTMGVNHGKVDRYNPDLNPQPTLQQTVNDIVKSRAITSIISNKYLLSLSILILLPVAPASGQQQREGFPFTREENADGARFIWYSMNRSGFARPYEPCAAIPTSIHYQAVTEPEMGDIAWWPTYMVVFVSDAGEEGIIIEADEMGSFKALVDSLGTPRFFRFIDTDGDSTGASVVLVDAFSHDVRCENPDPDVWLLESRQKSDDRGMCVVMLKRLPIDDDLGRPVEPVLAVISERLPEDSPPSLEHFASVYNARSFQEMGVTIDEKSQEDEMLIYRSHYERAGVLHRLIVAYRVYKSVGFQIITDSTEGVFNLVEDDMNSFIHSMEIRNN